MQHAGQADVVDVVPGRAGKRPGLPPAGHPSVNQLGIIGQHHVRPQPEPFHHPRPEALDQPVCIAAQVAHQGEAVGALDIDAQRAARAGQDIEWVEPCPGALHPDDLRTPIGQHHAAERTGTDARELDDTQA